MLRVFENDIFDRHPFARVDVNATRLQMVRLTVGVFIGKFRGAKGGDVADPPIGHAVEFNDMNLVLLPRVVPFDGSGDAQRLDADVRDITGDPPNCRSVADPGGVARGHVDTNPRRL